MASAYFDNSDPCRPTGLKVEEKIFWISKETLALYSPVFKAMFFGNFSEAQSQIVPLPDKKAEDILEMLLCLFPTGPTMKEVDSKNVNSLLALSDEYQIEFLKRKCRTFLTEKVRAIQGKNDDLWFVLGVASKYYLHDTMDECAKKCVVYTLDEAQNFMVDLPPIAVALVALYAWQAVATGIHVGRTYLGSLRCTNCRNDLPFYKCANCGQQFCAVCSYRTCRSVNLESLERLVETMKIKDS